ncbi:MAG: T9SS type A sorting domain-containing protein [Flavobacteriales bacterium]|nr:T9SS type A sorting domain-containing protein [Flavobacteriales bacterium]MCB9447875.1 T9SS type A sorting domain-containing protein [Flavobacteriales bacterium]
MNLQWEADMPAACSGLTLTMTHDQSGKPYLYVANKEAGLTVYDLSTPSFPTQVASIPLAQLDSLQVMNLSQYGDYIYLATGTHFNNNESSGMAIVNVSDPVSPVVTATWKHPTGTGGSGIVKVEDNMAYLGAMGNGLVLLDVTNKDSIRLVSTFIPDINWPVNNPTASLYNARGMVVQDSIVYLCYDAGGLRIINCTDPLHPRETGRYCNPVMYTPINRPRAYNNIVIRDTLAYVTVDYCGLEVIDIRDTSIMTLAGWWNPYDCPNNNWFTSPSHANEIALDTTCNRLYLSTGKSDLMVLDISDPTTPDSCNFYGGADNNIGTWGVSLYDHHIYLSYICTLGVPFASNWSGIKSLVFDPCITSTQNMEKPLTGLTIYPNPMHDDVNVECIGCGQAQEIRVLDVTGKEIGTIRLEQGKGKLHMAGLTDGIYFLVSKDTEQRIHEKIVHMTR